MKHIILAAFWSLIPVAACAQDCTARVPSCLVEASGDWSARFVGCQTFEIDYTGNQGVSMSVTATQNANLIIMVFAPQSWPIKYTSLLFDDGNSVDLSYIPNTKAFLAVLSEKQVKWFIHDFTSDQSVSFGDSPQHIVSIPLDGTTLAINDMAEWAKEAQIPLPFPFGQ